MPSLRLTIVAATLALAGCASIDTMREPSPNDFLIHGIDVSKYQGEIDWPAARDSGVTFAWIKATEGGDYKDAYFDHNWQAAKDAGIVRGAYHFAYWCRPAEEQVRWFEAQVPVDASAPAAASATIDPRGGRRTKGSVYVADSRSAGSPGPATLRVEGILVSNQTL